MSEAIQPETTEFLSSPAPNCPVVHGYAQVINGIRDSIEDYAGQCFDLNTTLLGLWEVQIGYGVACEHQRLEPRALADLQRVALSNRVGIENVTSKRETLLRILDLLHEKVTLYDGRIHTQADTHRKGCV
jgi:hypothetical protein